MRQKTVFKRFYFFESDNIDFSFESSSLAGSSRNYTSLSNAARENSLSRIYVGYHFRKAVDDGEALGINVGAWIATHCLQIVYKMITGAKR